MVLFSILLTSGCIIKGTVTQDGEAMKGVNISIERYYLGEYKIYRTAITDINGDYQILLPWGNYRVTLAASEFCNHDWLSEEAVVAFQGFFITNRIDWTLEKYILTGDYHITSDADIDNFYDGGNGYTYISGNLIIDNTNLTNLHGLECLSGIGGNLSIQNNPDLENVDGLYFLLEVNNDLTIANNPKLCTSKAQTLKDSISLEGNFIISNNDDDC